MQNETNVPANGDRLLLPVGEVARKLSISIRATWKLLSGGKLPPPLRLGRCVRWRKADVDSWVANGCPEPGARQTGGGR
ncbi:MAG: helix-turn-helix domain-containing protein [Planctomycetota bacterium]